MPRRAKTLVAHCGLKGCNQPRHPRNIFCASCTAKLPSWLPGALAHARSNPSGDRLINLIKTATAHLTQNGRRAKEQTA